ncbi:MAG: NUDIX domain-containing protein [Bacteroidales bacterium]|nr:NUDIX domain-containing protein [Bacteroidales bacterium]
MSEHQFNIRVYGLLTENDKILVTDEFRMNTLMTKFPGGALEFGEGTIDCLKREFMEELNLKVEVLDHFYTTDYYQPTKLIPATQQLVSIYYRVKPAEPMRFPIVGTPFSFPALIEGAQCFRWLSLDTLSEEDVTFPIDKRVVSLLLKST